MRPIRASEIGTFLYCQRAWWYQKNGYIPQNQPHLEAGLGWHERHGRKVLSAVRLRLVAYALILVALILAGFALFLQT